MQSRIRLPELVRRAKDIGSLDRLIRYHPLYYTRALYTIGKFNDAGMQERERLADEMRERTLNLALRTPYGKQYGHDFECWPILEKTTLRNNPDVCFTRSFPSIPASTGGTTGLPLGLSRSIQCIAAEQAFIDNLIRGYGLSFRSARIAVLRADEVKDLADDKPPFGVLRHAGIRLILSNAHMSRRTVDWFVSALKEFQPQVLWVYPGMLANLIRLMDEAGLNLKIPIVLASSELMEPSLYRAIEQTLSARVIDYYGQGERVCFAYSTQSGEYWFSPSYGYVELQPQNNCDIENGTKSARIIATSYWNNAMPLVRYNTGDLAIVPSSYTAKDCDEVALGIKPFFGIAGRSDEYIVTQDGKSIHGLNHLPRDIEHILQLQVVQESVDQVTIKVLARPDFSESDREKIAENARGLIPPEIDLTIDVVDLLEFAPNGKTPFVIRRV